MEDNTTALLVRSTSTSWGPSSVLAVDAGVHLAAISRILEQHSPGPNSNHTFPTTLSSGPFKDLKISHWNPSANAIDFVKYVIGTHLMTHPHLDHISGFVVNSSGFNPAERKILAGMPTTIEAIKKHIFNGIIWPNLSDENDGFALVSYLRMIPGGSPMVGNGGYVKLADGLEAKGVYIAHGHCNERHFRDPETLSNFALSPRLPHSPQQPSSARSAQSVHSAHSYSSQNLAQECTPSECHHLLPEAQNLNQSLGGKCVTDSTAFFIRDTASEQEIIIFGDLESDSISGKDLNRKLWIEAAPKVSSSLLKGLVIECSYSSARPDFLLFGHLTPIYLFEELQVLAGLVEELKSRAQRNQQIGHNHTSTTARGGPRPASLELKPNGASSYPPSGRWNRPLHGLTIVIIHVKDTLEDGPNAHDTILRELKELEAEHDLGCQFIMSSPGQAVYF
jgi:cAMP phosphodiesterase